MRHAQNIPSSLLHTRMQDAKGHQDLIIATAETHESVVESMC